MSDDDGVPETERVLDMRSYESDVIRECQEEKEEAKRETRDALRERVEKLKADLKQAKLKGKSREIERIERKLGETEITLQLPEQLDVDLDLSRPTVDNEMPVENQEMEKYWHYKVLHQSFVGTESIDLTIDDSDPFVYAARQQFILKHCEPYIEEHELEGGLKVSKQIWDSLFPHQRSAIEWEWGLWQQGSGGIEGDEMGLGKTIICAVFIGALMRSKLLSKPVLILCPLTVTKQWIREFHIWCPEVKAVLLHQTRANSKVSDEEILESAEDNPIVIVTNYEYLQRKGDVEAESMSIPLLDWGCVLCDEGHKIRNAESGISKLVKKISGDFRLAISGSPIQNSLVELWSLFDFANPRLLGSLEVFERDFATPIKIGGYTNATPSEIYRAYYAAVDLRNLIRPYLLRRLKSDVMADLPGKSEKILFVGLTPKQIRAYEEFLDSPFCQRILSGATSEQCFAGIDHLRKICDHPALLEETSTLPTIENSAKLKLLQRILPHWHKHGHRALLFSQYLRMLDFIGEVLDGLGLDYFRIDGDTNAGERQHIMDRFNAGEKFACILTTRVGGIGVNLIGADRVIIVDPDWNPATDVQALERVWRIGQTRDVCVYRLITNGTIEEKMYKKQIFKQFLSNKILQSPGQKRLFKRQTIFDLFKLDTMDEREEEEDQEESSWGDEDSDAGDERKMVDMLVNGGDIQKIGDHDVPSDNISGQEAVDKELARKESRRAVERLKQEKPSEVTECESELIKYFRERDGVAGTKDVYDTFVTNGDREMRIVRRALRTIAICNKKNHVWILRRKFYKS